jgi:membrane protease YdiL (CAAX protease family)
VIVQLAYALAALLLLVFARIPAPPVRVGTAAAVGVGLGAAVLLYAALARGRGPAPARPLALALAAAVSEEVVWRWGVLAATAPRVGWAAAVALAATGFAYRHTRGAGLVTYLLLGAAFGAVFVATGRLAAAIAAHAGYNTLVLGRP